jgi:hypothetical protein
MTVYTYRFHARPLPAFHWSPMPQLTSESVQQAIVGALIRELTPSPQGAALIEVAMERPSHGDALDEISTALQQLGFDVAQALVTEWATAAVEGAIAGAAGGGALGSATRDAGTVVATVIVGGLVGAAFGSLKPVLKASYQAVRLHPFGGGWQLTSITGGGAAPGLAWN